MTSAHALITGGAGMLAVALRDRFSEAGMATLCLSRDQLDVTNADAVHRVIEDVRPRIVVQCAAFTRVDDAEKNESAAFAVNANAVMHVAAACKSVGARLVYPSTDYVFDGSATTPYRPDDATNPINAYGRSKLAGEHAARAAGDYLVVRTSWLYGRGGRNFVRTVTERMRRGEALRVVNDQTGAPTWTADLARALVQGLTAGVPSGVYHLTNSGQTTWFGVAEEIRRVLQLDADLVPCSSAQYPTPATRPAYSVLDAGELLPPGMQMRAWQPALREALLTSGF